jgi:hypothetical protein
MSTPRNIISVIEAMISVSEDEKLNNELNDLIGTIRYTAPEQMNMRWWQLGDIVSASFPPPDELNEWQTKVADYLMAKTPLPE